MFTQSPYFQNQLSHHSSAETIEGAIFNQENTVPTKVTIIHCKHHALYLSTSAGNFDI